MTVVYYGVDNGEGLVPANVLEDGEPVSSKLIPLENLSDKEKPGKIVIDDEIEEETDILEGAEDIDASEYLVKEWKNGKAKRIYSGLMSSLEDDWEDVNSLKVYGDGEIFTDGEKVKGEFTVTQGSTVLIKDVQDITERTDQEMENEYYHCIYCDKEVKSYKAIENMLPENWNLDPSDEGRRESIEKKEDGDVILKGVCPECAEKKEDS